MPRLYSHLFLSEGCEAPGCRARRTSLYPRPGGLVRACSPGCAAEADHRLSEEEADRISTDQHLVEGELVELDAPPLEEVTFGPAGAIW